MPNQSQPQSQANSLLNLLNPYQQSTRDVRHLPHSAEGDEGEPESPSAMLLRELQGQSDEDEERERERYIRDEREGMSPTPTPSRSVLGLGMNTISNQKSGKETTTTNSSEDDEQPPQSLMYQPGGSDRRTSHTRAEESPGPFRPAGSSSTSESRRSASTSPGPSTISNYASGLDLESTVEPTVSPVTSTKNIHIPTFREPPRPSRTISGSSKRPPSERGDSQGYLDPPLSSSRKGKGKEKEKKVGGRKYHQVQDSDDHAGDDRKVGKGGLNDYEKALWKWVNVDDLDGFLQEVSFLRLSFLWDTADVGLRIL
jgi:autophagy-related protein 9